MAVFCLAKTSFAVFMTRFIIIIHGFSWKIYYDKQTVYDRKLRVNKIIEWNMHNYRHGCISKEIHAIHLCQLIDGNAKENFVALLGSKQFRPASR